MWLDKRCANTYLCGRRDVPTHSATSDEDGLVAFPNRNCDMAWIYLAIAAVIEVIWAASLKASDGFTKPHFVAVMLVAMLATSWLLAMATRHLPLGVAYAVWTGAGIVGSLLVGWLVYGETLDTARMIAVVLIAAGVIILKCAPA
tara:strand:- start:2893 stop:3327 length:435 start_codon:yes stop_codon:yes gene_type:complete